MMNYPKSLQYLNSFLNLEKIDWSQNNQRWNLDRMGALLRLFEYPQKSYFSIIIAGTKGKGSTGFFLESILKAAGVRVGFYCSPHLVDPRERIRLNGQMISKENWARVFSDIQKKQTLAGKNAVGLGHVTYFEMMTLAAAYAFKQSQAQVGIFEVGMGGRLDATNAIGAKLAIITPVHFDHEAILGDKLWKIAREKAGVIKKGAEVICAPQAPEALAEIKKRSRIQKAKLCFPSPVSAKQIALSGDHQRQNAALALEATEKLKKMAEISISKAAQRKGLLGKSWPARFEVAAGKPDVILDGAHNPAAIGALVRTLKKRYPKRKGTLLFGVQRDKNAAQMLRLLSSVCETALVAQTSESRAQSVEVLVAQARDHFKQVIPVSGSASQGVRMAKRFKSSEHFTIATGSFYLVGEVRKQFNGNSSS